MQTITKSKKISRVGVGTYRYVDAKSPVQSAALLRSILNGIHVIDTAGSYGDGASETLIGSVINSLEGSTTDGSIPSRNDLFIISKFGYVLGTNYATNYNSVRIQKSLEMIQLGPETFYSMHPDFIRKELTLSLNRLQTNHLDSYLVHNPEHYLMSKLDHNEEDRNKIASYQDKLKDYVHKAFVALEKEVKEGRINSYGVSSNSFCLSDDHPHFVPYSSLIDISKKAAKEVHDKEAPSFKIVQFPANVLETNGLQHCAKWAKANHIKVFTNRPLNAFTSKGEWRLATYEDSSDYDRILQKTAETFKNHVFLSALIRDLDREKINFVSAMHFESDLQQQIVPMFVEKLKEFAYTPEIWDQVIQFLNVYEQKVRYMCYLKTKDYIDSMKIGYSKRGETLNSFAIKYLLDNNDIDCVLNGITKEEYVDKVVDVLKSHPRPQTEI